MDRDAFFNEATGWLAVMLLVVLIVIDILVRSDWACVL